MDDTVHNSQPTWTGNDTEPMDTPGERISALEKQVFSLQNENESMRASGTDLLKEKTALKEHNTALADIIANLNSYVTQF